MTKDEKLFTKCYNNAQKISGIKGYPLKFLDMEEFGGTTFGVIWKDTSAFDLEELGLDGMEFKETTVVVDIEQAKWIWREESFDFWGLDGSTKIGSIKKSKTYKDFSQFLTRKFIHELGHVRRGSKYFGDNPRYVCEKDAELFANKFIPNSFSLFDTLSGYASDFDSRKDAYKFMPSTKQIIDAGGKEK